MICVCISVFLSLCIYLCFYLCVILCTCMYISVCVCVCLSVCISVCIDLCVCLLWPRALDCKRSIARRLSICLLPTVILDIWQMKSTFLCCLNLAEMNSHCFLISLRLLLTFAASRPPPISKVTTSSSDFAWL